MRQKSIPTFIIALLVSVQVVAQDPWKIKEDYIISFSGIKAEGTFRGLSGEILFDPSNPEASKFDVSVSVKTISTGNKTKDKHARGDSWFDAAAFPEIRFTSSRVISRDGNEFEVIGDLELKGITREMPIVFTFSSEGMKGLFEGRMEVNREDFGIEGNFFGFVVGEDFEVELRIPVEKIDR